MRLPLTSFALLFVVLTFAVPSAAEAQVSEASWEAAQLTPPPLLEKPAKAPGSRPFLRTFAALAGSAGAFAYAQSRVTAAPDELLVPIAAGIVGGAVGGLLFTNAHPVRVLLGSALATVPAGALATYLAGITADDQQAQIPLVAFSIPHGLLTSAFAQHR